MEENNDGDEVEEREMRGRERKEMGMVRKMEFGALGSGEKRGTRRERVKGRGNALSEPGSVQRELVRFFNWAGSVQFWPGSSIPNIFTIFLVFSAIFLKLFKTCETK